MARVYTVAGCGNLKNREKVYREHGALLRRFGLLKHQDWLQIIYASATHRVLMAKQYVLDVERVFDEYSELAQAEAAYVQASANAQSDVARAEAARTSEDATPPRCDRDNSDLQAKRHAVKLSQAKTERAERREAARIAWLGVLMTTTSGLGLHP